MKKLLHFFTKLKPYWVTLFLLFSIIYLCSYRWQKENITSIITSDGIGYYEYLQAVFNDNNLDHLKENEIYTNTTNNGKNYIKYTCGVAILILPFFLIAHFIEFLLKVEQSGFSEISHVLISLSSLFYLILGLIFLNQLMKIYTINLKNRIISILFIFFGTNLFYYTYIYSSSSHVFSFFAIASFLLSSKKYVFFHNQKHLYLSSILLALIVLIRPTNVVVIFIVPFLAGSFEELKKTAFHFFKNKTQAFFSFLIFGSIIFIQPILWYVQTGFFYVKPYNDEGFYLSNPQFLKLLFSFRKGLFVYSPILLFLFVGVAFIFKKSKYQFFTITFFLIAVSYLFAAWWNWYYGDSFGQRVFIDYYSIAALLIAIGLEDVKQYALRISVLFIGSIFLIFNLFQTYQYCAGIIHPYNMDAAKYKYIFLKFNSKYKFVLGGNKDLEPYGFYPKKLIYSTKNNFEKSYKNWHGDNIVSVENNSYYSYKNSEWGATFTMQNDTAFYNSRKLFVTASINRIEFENGSSLGAYFVVNTQNKDGKTLYYSAFPINDYPDNEACKWRKYNYSFIVPKQKFIDNKLLIYICNPAKGNFAIDDFEMNIYKIY